MTNNTKIVSLALLAATSSFGLITTNAKADTVSDFKSKMATPVRNAANRYNVWPSVMMAQATLESGWGQSTLSKEANNYFGIKGTYNGQYVNMNTAEYDSAGNLYYVVAQFKKYPSPEESMNDNGNLIRNGLSWNHAYYSGSWRENAATYQQAAQALVGKYATDPVYGNKLVNLIQQYGFHELVDETIKPAKYAVGQKVQLTNGALNTVNGDSIKDMQGWVGTVKSVQQRSYSQSQWQYTIEFKSGTTTYNMETILEQDLQSAPSAAYWTGARLAIANTALNASDGKSLVAHQGWKGTITNVSLNNKGTSHYQYTIKYDNGQVDANVLEQDFTVLPSNYKVGQQVQLTAGALDSLDGTNLRGMPGWIGTIKSITRNTHSTSFYEYTIEFPTGKTVKTVKRVLDQDIMAVNSQPAYKVGNQLSVVNTANNATNNADLSGKRGWLGKITAVSVNNMGSSHYQYTLSFNTENKTISVPGILQQDLTAVLPTAQFKVGSRVAVTDGALNTVDGTSIKNKRGQFGTVTAVTQTNLGYSAYAYNVKFDDGSSVARIVQQDLTTAPAPSQFKVGDNVQLTSGALNALNGVDIREKQGWIGTIQKVTYKKHSQSNYMFTIKFQNGAKTDTVDQILEQDVKVPESAGLSNGARVIIKPTALNTATGPSLVSRQNQAGTVTGISINNEGSSHYAYTVKFDSDNATITQILQQDLQTLPAARYRVGESVALANGALNEFNGTSLKDHQGWIGTIQSVTPKIYSTSNYTYKVAFKSGTKTVTHTTVLEQDLTTPKQGMFGVGARVQVAGTALNATDGGSLVSSQYKIGTVTAIGVDNGGYSPYAYTVKFDDGTTMAHILQQDLWNAPAAAKFKVGDNIQLTSGALEALDGTNLRDKNRWVGVVKSVTPKRYSSSNYMYQVEFTNGKQKFVINTILEQYVQQPENAAYATGTRVKLTAGANATASGASLIGRQGWAGVVTNVYATNLGSSHYAYDIRYDNSVTETSVLQQDLTK